MRDAFIEAVEGEELVRPGDRVLIAVSGGRDSVVLLHLFLSAADALGCRCCVAHLDHGMRDESGADASFVRRLCEKWHVPYFEGQADVPALARDRGLGLEEAARHERRRFLQRVAQQQSCRVIALGHHRADQVETFLHRLLRGTGTSGLAAMRPQSGRFVRPLLDFPPESLATYARRHR
nr:tRNA lysidine(34) synthetase TilS [Desulfuromonadales bacterium]